jgi:4-hydroxy-3-methylbut-2-enyl diphosphate reductase
LFQEAIKKNGYFFLLLVKKNLHSFNYTRETRFYKVYIAYYKGGRYIVGNFMHVIIPKLSGFCPGVRSAEKKLLAENGKVSPGRIYAYGNIINNSNYINYLADQDIQTVTVLEKLPCNAYVAIRTHGIDRHEEAGLHKKFKLIDLTCVNVKRVQLSIREYADKGYFTVITGKKNHPEIKGLISYAKEFKVIETDDELECFLTEYPGLIKTREHNKIFIVSQTTGRKDFFEKAVDKITHAFLPETEIVTYNSICPLTNRKEEEALRLQEHADITFVVGDSLSSNANKLFNILAEKGRDVYFISDLAGLVSLKLPLKQYHRALLVSSASTPQFIEEEIRRYLETL